eukprot:gene73-532_t
MKEELETAKSGQFLKRGDKQAEVCEKYPTTCGVFTNVAEFSSNPFGETRIVKVGKKKTKFEMCETNGNIGGLYAASGDIKLIVNGSDPTTVSEGEVIGFNFCHPSSVSSADGAIAVFAQGWHPEVAALERTHAIRERSKDWKLKEDQVKDITKIANTHAKKSWDKTARTFRKNSKRHDEIKNAISKAEQDAKDAVEAEIEAKRKEAEAEEENKQQALEELQKKRAEKEKKKAEKEAARLERKKKALEWRCRILQRSAAGLTAATHSRSQKRLLTKSSNHMKCFRFIGNEPYVTMHYDQTYDFDGNAQRHGEIVLVAVAKSDRGMLAAQPNMQYMLRAMKEEGEALSVPSAVQIRDTLCSTAFSPGGWICFGLEEEAEKKNPELAYPNVKPINEKLESLKQQRRDFNAILEFDQANELTQEINTLQRKYTSELKKAKDYVKKATKKGIDPSLDAAVRELDALHKGANCRRDTSAAISEALRKHETWQCQQEIRIPMPRQQGRLEMFRLKSELKVLEKSVGDKLTTRGPPVMAIGRTQK